MRHAMPNLVRRAPARPLVWLGERERTIASGPGERFPAYHAKEKDLLFDPLRRNA